MKISIWQQFSSNHSSYFTLIGIFESPTNAQKASEKIRSVLDQIAAWHKANPEASENIFENYPEFLDGEGLVSEPERLFAIQYHINWNLPVLWFDVYESTTFEHFIFIKSRWQADTGAYPIYELINRLGGQALIQGDLFGFDLGNEARLSLWCDAPDEETAAKIAGEFKGWQSGKTVYNIDFTPEGNSFYIDSTAEIVRVLTALKTYGCTGIRVEATQVRTTYLGFDDDT